MKLLRELVYEEKPSRYDFGINEERTMNNRIYEWLLLRKELDPEEKHFYSRITKVFNDAYFVCTVALLWPGRELSLSYFKNKIRMPNIVYPMVYYYISLLKKRGQNTNRFLIMIKNLINKNPDMKENFEDLEKIEKESSWNIEPSLFDHRRLTPNLLSIIEWGDVTEGYKPMEIKKIIELIARDGKDCKMIAEAIINSAQKTEEEFYNSSSYYYEDENEQYDEPENESRDFFVGPDYSEAYQLCNGIISDNGASLNLIIREADKEKEVIESLEEENNTFPIKKRLKDLLTGEWFDEFSIETEKYTADWRENMIDDLMNTNYEDDIVKMWKEKKINLVKCSIVGALLEVGVLKGRKKELAQKLDIPISDKSKSDYIGNKKIAPYIEWLRGYVENNNNEPFSD